MYNSPFKDKDIDNINRVEPENTSNAMMNGDKQTTKADIVGRRRSSTTEDQGDGYTKKTIEVRRRDGSLKKTKVVHKGDGKRSSKTTFFSKERFDAAPSYSLKGVEKIKNKNTGEKTKVYNFKKK